MKHILQSMAFLICLSIVGFVRAQSSTPIRAQRDGVLLLAHGGSAQEWNEEVRHVADQVDLTVPTEVAFGMATKSTMQVGINRLVARGVTEIVVVPLFVSSHSSVIDSTAYLLGLRAQEPEDLKIFAMMDHGGGMMMGGSPMQHDPAATAEWKNRSPSCSNLHGLCTQTITGLWRRFCVIAPLPSATTRRTKW